MATNSRDAENRDCRMHITNNIISKCKLINNSKHKLLLCVFQCQPTALLCALSSTEGG